MVNNKQQLVILPGWGGTRESWKDFVEKAEADFDVSCLEMPCFGEKPCPNEVWGVDEYADWVSGEISSLKNPIILGHSFGGQVAVNLVSRQKTACSKLILSGAAVLRPQNKLKKTFFAVLAKTGKIVFSLPGLSKLEKFAKKALYKVADSPDYDKTEGVKREIFKKVIGQSQKDKLQDITVPTLVVWGSCDSYVPLSQGKIIASLIPGAKLEVIEKGRHGLHIHSTEKFLEIIKKFSIEN